MNPSFKNIGIIEFSTQFSTDEKCMEYLSNEKWKSGFICRKCGHTNYCKGKKPFSRRCTRCKSEESATAHTIFHKCKIPLAEAFKITFLVCGNPDISTSKLSDKIDLRTMTCWKLKKKILECIDSKGEIDLLDMGSVNQ